MKEIKRRKGEKIMKIRELRRKCKRGQEEIAGFVVIVVIVAVVFLVILGLYLRQKTPSTQKESIDVSQFLKSAMQYTSECSDGIEYFSLGSLISECYYKSDCSSAKNSCDVLKRTLQGIIENNWKFGEESPSKGYIFNSSYASNFSREDVIFLSGGECKINKIGAEYFSRAWPGTITSTLTICS